MKFEVFKNKFHNARKLSRADFKLSLNFTLFSFNLSVLKQRFSLNNIYRIISLSFHILLSHTPNQACVHKGGRWVWSTGDGRRSNKINNTCDVPHGVTCLSSDFVNRFKGGGSGLFSEDTRNPSQLNVRGSADGTSINRKRGRTIQLFNTIPACDRQTDRHRAV